MFSIKLGLRTADTSNNVEIVFIGRDLSDAQIFRAITRISKLSAAFPGKSSVCERWHDFKFTVRARYVSLQHMKIEWSERPFSPFPSREKVMSERDKLSRRALHFRSFDAVQRIPFSKVK